MSLPSVLYDEDSMVVWSRADRRGQAQALAASLIGCDFVEIQVRRVWARFVPTATPADYRGWIVEGGVLSPCLRTAAGATPYWECVYIDVYERRRRRAAA